MLSMEYDITIGKFRLGMVDSITVKKSVETLCDTATIVLPSSYINKAVGIESKLHEGDEVLIALGYSNQVEREFVGYLNSISTDDSKVTLDCEDSIYLFRKSLPDKEYVNTSLKSLLQSVVKAIKPSYEVECDYDFTYDRFVVKDATAWDVLKKVQDETKANVYFKGKTLHVHPQYSEIENEQAVVYDFSVNIEKSSLKWKRADQREYLVEIEGILPNGERVKEIAGKPGGDKRSVKLYVTDRASLKSRAEEEMKMVVYTGFEGNVTGWLVPYCEPGYKIELRDAEYPDKNGTYYVVATETRFSSSGGERVVTIGKKID